MCVSFFSLCHLSVMDRGSTVTRGKAGVLVTSDLGESEWRCASKERVLTSCFDGGL